MTKIMHVGTQWQFEIFLSEKISGGKKRTGIAFPEFQVRKWEANSYRKNRFKLFPYYHGKNSSRARNWKIIVFYTKHMIWSHQSPVFCASLPSFSCHLSVFQSKTFPSSSHEWICTSFKLQLPQYRAFVFFPRFHEYSITQCGVSV